MNEIFYKAQELAEGLKKDILFASTRAEHVRLTQRASEAEYLVQMLRQVFDDGK